jgi:ankyrin repeat protein
MGTSSSTQVPPKEEEVSQNEEEEEEEEGSQFYDVNVDNDSENNTPDVLDENYTRLLQIVKDKRKEDLQLFVDSDLKGGLAMTPGQISAILNRPDEAKKTPIQYALEQGSLDIAKFLLENGAKIRDVADFLQPKLFSSIITKDKAASDTVFRLAEDYIPAGLLTPFFNLLYTKPYLDENGSLIFKANVSLLHLAAGVGNYAVTKYLISKGVDVNLKNDTRDTPLHYAVFPYDQKCKFITMNLLLENGANIDAKNESGMTPLHLFAMKTTNDNDNLMCFHVLISHLMSISSLRIKDKVGKTPGEYCWSDTQVCSLFQKLTEKTADKNDNEENSAFDNKRKCSIRIRNSKIKANMKEFTTRLDRLIAERNAALKNGSPLDKQRIEERIKQVKNEILVLASTPLPLGKYESECKAAEDAVKNVPVFDANTALEGTDDKEEAVVDGKEEAVVDGKEEAVVDGKEEAVVDGKEEAVVDDKEEAVVDGKEEAVVDDKEEAVVDDKEEAVVDDKEEAVVDGKEENKDSNNGIEQAIARLASANSKFISAAASLPRGLPLSTSEELRSQRESIIEQEKQLSVPTPSEPPPPAPTPPVPPPSEPKRLQEMLDKNIERVRRAKDRIENTNNKHRQRIMLDGAMEMMAKQKRDLENLRLLISNGNTHVGPDNKEEQLVAIDDSLSKLGEYSEKLSGLQSKDGNAYADEVEAQVQRAMDSEREKEAEELRSKKETQMAQLAQLEKAQTRLSAFEMELASLNRRIAEKYERSTREEPILPVEPSLPTPGMAEEPVEPSLPPPSSHQQLLTEISSLSPEEKTRVFEDLRDRIQTVILTGDLLLNITPRYSASITTAKNTLLEQPDLLVKYAEFHARPKEDQQNAMLLLETKYGSPDGAPVGLILLHEGLLLTAKDAVTYMELSNSNTNALRRPRDMLTSYVTKLAQLMSNEHVFLAEHLLHYSSQYNLDYSGLAAVCQDQSLLYAHPCWAIVKTRLQTYSGLLNGGVKDMKFVKSLREVFNSKLQMLNQIRITNAMNQCAKS